MYTNKEDSRINILFAPIHDSYSDEGATTMSFRTNKDTLGDVMDYILPSKGTINDVDLIGRNEIAKVQVDFDTRKEMKDFIRLFSPGYISEARANLRRYEKQKKDAVL